MTDRPGDRVRVVVAVAILALLGLGVWGERQEQVRLAGDLTDARADLDEMADGVVALRAQVDALGGDPVVDLEDSDRGPVAVEVPGPQGPPGRAPTEAEVRQAVARYCELNNCVGPQGPAPTSLQVAAAVSSYCDARGQCAGATGEPGAAGAEGAPGPGPSDTQIAAAVESYCSTHGGCSGPAGADGLPGADGAPGPACPEGAEPVTWTVDPPESVVTGLEPGTYVICRAAA